MEESRVVYTRRRLCARIGLVILHKYDAAQLFIGVRLVLQFDSGRTVVLLQEVVCVNRRITHY